MRRKGSLLLLELLTQIKMPKLDADIVHFHRKPLPGNFSMENLFRDLRVEMEKQMAIRVEECPHYSKGVLPRFKNMFWARKQQGQVNHITGDVNYLALLINPERTVLTVHDCVNLERLAGIRRWILKKLWFDWPIRRVRYVTVISEATRDRLLELTSCPAEKVRVIYNPISDTLRPSPKAMNQKKPVFLHIGTKSNKNLTRHIKAISGIPCVLRILGRLTDEQVRLLEAHKIEYFNRYDLTYEEVVEEYKACDIVLFASTYEGFGLPIVEAQAIGRPVITSNCWSMPEVAGVGALLVDPLSVREIKAAALRLINEPHLRVQLRDSGFENALRFNSQKICSEYMEVYSELCTSGNN